MLGIRSEACKKKMLRSLSVLHLRAIQRGYVVSQDTVGQLIKLTDPEGVQDRRARRLRCRHYHCTGPSALWHMDGYDKLKPYGIVRHMTLYCNSVRSSVSLVISQPHCITVHQLFIHIPSHPHFHTSQKCIHLLYSSMYAIVYVVFTVYIKHL